MSQPAFQPSLRWGYSLLVAGLLGTGCHRELPTGGLVLTELPASRAEETSTPDVLDARYPAGSRVVIVLPDPSQKGQSGYAKTARDKGTPASGAALHRPSVAVLSAGLWSAGAPCVSADGSRVVFVGKAQSNGTWQIYEATALGQRPVCITHIPGGAMDPTIIAGGDLVFASPVPRSGETWTTPNPVALYRQHRSLKPTRITFGAKSAVEPTALEDGRILFVSAQPNAVAGDEPHLALFTINNDGTEVTAFTAQHDGVMSIHRPRELPGGRIAFLAAKTHQPAEPTWAEFVRTARPFASRAPLSGGAEQKCASVEPGPDGGLVLCQMTRGMMGRSMHGSYSVFRTAAEGTDPQIMFGDPAYDTIEATELRSHAQPKGHISTMDLHSEGGTILCLDANRSAYPGSYGTSPKAQRVRITAIRQGKLASLGEVPLQPDGSFMADVPADIPLGFDSLDSEGHVIRTVPPVIWVRAGENRTCLGCHEPHNRAPRNVRPLAALQPPARLIDLPKPTSQLLESASLPPAAPRTASNRSNQPGTL